MVRVRVRVMGRVRGRVRCRVRVRGHHWLTLGHDFEWWLIHLVGLGLGLGVGL